MAMLWYKYNVTPCVVISPLRISLFLQCPIVYLCFLYKETSITIKNGWLTGS